MNYEYQQFDTHLIEQVESKFVTFNDLAKLLNVSVEYIYRKKESFKHTTLFNLYVVPIEECTRLKSERAKTMAKREQRTKNMLAYKKRIKDKISLDDLKNEAEELQIKVSGLSKSQLAIAIKEVKKRQEQNPAIGKSLDHIVDCSYMYSVCELKEALNSFTKPQINLALQRANLELVNTYFRKEVFIDNVLDVIGVGYA